MQANENPAEGGDKAENPQEQRTGKRGRAFSRWTWEAFRRTGAVLASVAAIGSVVGGLLTYFDVYSRLTSKQPPPAVQPSKSPRILILPFSASDGSDAQASLLAAGIVRDAVAGLSRFPSIKVIGASTSAALVTSGRDPAALRQKYGVTHVVSGNFHIANEAFRLDIELVETEAGVAIWTQSFGGPVVGVVNAGDEVVRIVVGKVAAAVRQADLRHAATASVETLSAYHLTLQARQLWQRPQPHTLPQAQDLLAKAIAVDPAYAPAHAYLAFTYLTSYNNSWSPGYEKRDTLIKMLEQASRALDLDPEYGAAHTAQAIAYTYLGRHSEARSAAQHALRANASDADVLTRVGQVMSFLGEHEQAIRHLNDAIDLDPLGTAQRLNFLSRAYFFGGNYNQAIENARLCLDKSKIEPCRETLAAALALSGRLQQAADVWREIPGAGRDADPERIVSRLRPAFKRQQDLDKLVSGLALAKDAAGSAKLQVHSQ